MRDIKIAVLLLLIVGLIYCVKKDTTLASPSELQISPESLRSGDIIFRRGPSVESEALMTMDHTANFSHAGIVLKNSARSDLRFNNFQYKADMAGTPLRSDRKAPEKPQINDPNFYDKAYRYGTQQVHTKTYSGPGFAVLKHYNDGRWVLKEVRWQFQRMDW